jgi:hypothetical protein
MMAEAGNAMVSNCLSRRVKLPSPGCPGSGSVYAETVRNSRFATCNRYSSAQTGEISTDSKATLHPIMNRCIMGSSSREGSFKENMWLKCSQIMTRAITRIDSDG